MDQTRERSPPAGGLAKLGRYAVCLLCAGNSEQAWCEACHRDMLARGLCCPRCAAPVQIAGPCGRCLRDPPAFDGCRALYRYQGPAATLIHRYKYRAEDGLADSFAEYFALATCSQGPLPQCLVPIPLHWHRQRYRGFNQSQWLAKRLARLIPVPCHELLRRGRDTPSQTRLAAPQRRDNLCGAFVLQTARPPRHLALVDDVLTSGATANEAARLLKEKGCQTVEVWVLARATHPSSAPSEHGH